jgi:hypothetical protein
MKKKERGGGEALFNRAKSIASSSDKVDLQLTTYFLLREYPRTPPHHRLFSISESPLKKKKLDGNQNFCRHPVGS